MSPPDPRPSARADAPDPSPPGAPAERPAPTPQAGDGVAGGTAPVRHDAGPDASGADPSGPVDGGHPALPPHGRAPADPSTPGAPGSPPLPPGGGGDLPWSEEAAGAGPPRRPARRRRMLSELPVLVVVALVLALLLRAFVVQAFYIPSGSMAPTLEVGDRVLVSKLSYDVFGEPERGDLVVFRDGEATGAGPLSGLLAPPPGQSDFIKRIIALPGEEVAVEHGTVMIDGEPLDEQPVGEGGYLADELDSTSHEAVEVPEGHYYLLGDNRANSDDSRYSIGTVPEEEIVGRAFVLMWPPARAEVFERPSYHGVPAGSG